MNDDSLSEPLTRHFLQADVVPSRIFCMFHLITGIFANSEETAASSNGASCKLTN
jgi:hypothetical protein